MLGTTKLEEHFPLVDKSYVMKKYPFLKKFNKNFVKPFIALEHGSFR
jgi:hypothetical protein